MGTSSIADSDIFIISVNSEHNADIQREGPSAAAKNAVVIPFARPEANASLVEGSCSLDWHERMRTIAKRCVFLRS